MPRVCVGNKFIFPLTFTEWRKQEKNTYVSHSLARYSQGSEEDSIWCPRKIFSEHPGKCLASRLFFYEKWVREECDVSPLLEQNLGCWCPPGQMCHVDVLLRVLSELKQSIVQEFIVDFPECMSPMKKNLNRTKPTPPTHDLGVPYSPSVASIRKRSYAFSFTDAPLHLDVPSQTVDVDDANVEIEEVAPQKDDAVLDEEITTPYLTLRNVVVVDDADEKNNASTTPYTRSQRRRLQYIYHCKYCIFNTKYKRNLTRHYQRWH